MRQAGVHLVSVVQVTVSLPSGVNRTVPFQVVAQVSLPVLAGNVSLGSGAVLTTAGYENALCAPGLGQRGCRNAVLQETNGGGLLVSFVSGSPGRAAINHYLYRYQSIAALHVTPTSLVNFGEAVNFPVIFGAMLALFGAATSRSPARGERLPPATGSRALEGARVREPPGCLGSELAVHDTRPGGDSRRRSPRGRSGSRDMERVR